MNQTQDLNAATGGGSALTDLLGWINADERLPNHECLAICKMPYGKNVIIKAFYANAFEVEQSYSDEIDLDYSEEKGDYFLKEGWYELVTNWPEFFCLTVTEGIITHWMPLPELPNALVRGGALDKAD